MEQINCMQLPRRSLNLQVSVGCGCRLGVAAVGIDSRQHGDDAGCYKRQQAREDTRPIAGQPDDASYGSKDRGSDTERQVHPAPEFGPFELALRRVHGAFLQPPSFLADRREGGFEITVRC
jgi:hypothetical protein